MRMIIGTNVWRIHIKEVIIQMQRYLLARDGVGRRYLVLMELRGATISSSPLYVSSGKQNRKKHWIYIKTVMELPEWLLDKNAWFNIPGPIYSPSSLQNMVINRLFFFPLYHVEPLFSYKWRINYPTGYRYYRSLWTHIYNFRRKKPVRCRAEYVRPEFADCSRKTSERSRIGLENRKPPFSLKHRTKWKKCFDRKCRSR